ncbi:MAG: tetratricopeptide repeat protein [Verrucomicrobiales bacterium]
MNFCPKNLLVSIVLLGWSFAVANAQDPGQLQSLWAGVTKLWSDGDLAGSEAAAGALIGALQPKATDFSLGVQLNSAYHNRASIRFMLGDYPGAEADLLLSLQQAAAIQPPPGLPPQAIPQMMAMVDDRKRLSLRALTNFYLASGDLERATARFREALAIRPLWEKQGEDNPAMAYQVLASEISTMEGTFHRQTGDYPNAMEAF